MLDINRAAVERVTRIGFLRRVYQAQRLQRCNDVNCVVMRVSLCFVARLSFSLEKVKENKGPLCYTRTLIFIEH
jgi:hypothetical protein